MKCPELGIYGLGGLITGFTSRGGTLITNKVIAVVANSTESDYILVQ